MCYAFTNLSQRILLDCKEWKYGDPVGLKVQKGHIVSENELSLLQAYHFLGAPIEAFDDLPPLILTENYSYSNASAALVGKLLEGSGLQRFVEKSPEWIDGLDDEALNFSLIHFEYDKLEYNQDGIRLTSREKKGLRHMGEYEPEEEYHNTISDVARGGEPSLLSSLGTSAGAAAAAAGLSNINQSISPSLTASAHSTASTNAPYPEPYRGSRPSRRSWEWSNRNRQRQESRRNLGHPNLPSFEPALLTRQVQHYNPQMRGARHAGSTPHLPSSALTRHPYRRPPPLTCISATIPARTEQNILRDPRTGNVRTARVIEIDFDRLGLPAYEARPRRRQHWRPQATYRGEQVPPQGPTFENTGYQWTDQQRPYHQSQSRGYPGHEQEPSHHFGTAGPSLAPSEPFTQPGGWLQPQSQEEESPTGRGTAASLGPFSPPPSTGACSKGGTRLALLTSCSASRCRSFWSIALPSCHDHAPRSLRLPASFAWRQLPDLNVIRE